MTLHRDHPLFNPATAARNEGHRRAELTRGRVKAGAMTPAEAQADAAAWADVIAEAESPLVIDTAATDRRAAAALLARRVAGSALKRWADAGMPDTEAAALRPIHLLRLAQFLALRAGQKQPTLGDFLPANQVEIAA